MASLVIWFCRSLTSIVSPSRPSTSPLSFSTATSRACRSSEFPPHRLRHDAAQCDTMRPKQLKAALRPSAHAPRRATPPIRRRNKLQLVGIVCVLIASKIEEISPPAIDEFVYISDNTFLKPEILRMESAILLKLEFSLTAATSSAFLVQVPHTDPYPPSVLALPLPPCRVAQYGATIASLTPASLHPLPTLSPPSPRPRPPSPRALTPAEPRPCRALSTYLSLGTSAAAILSTSLTSSVSW